MKYKKKARSFVAMLLALVMMVRQRSGSARLRPLPRSWADGDRHRGTGGRSPYPAGRLHRQREKHPFEAAYHGGHFYQNETALKNCKITAKTA